MSETLKNRLKSYSFWVSLASAVLLLVQAIGKPLGLVINEEIYMSIVNSVLGVFVVLGIISHPAQNLLGSKTDQTIITDSTTTATDSAQPGATIKIDSTQPSATTNIQSPQSVESVNPNLQGNVKNINQNQQNNSKNAENLQNFSDFSMFSQTDALNSQGVTVSTSDAQSTSNFNSITDTIAMGISPNNTALDINTATSNTTASSPIYNDTIATNSTLNSTQNASILQTDLTQNTNMMSNNDTINSVSNAGLNNNAQGANTQSNNTRIINGMVVKNYANHGGGVEQDTKSDSANC